MTDIFTASNGVTLQPRETLIDWRMKDLGGVLNFNLDTLVDDALAEWYQHRRDVELGRWRDEHDPDMVVYPVLADPGTVMVIAEREGVAIPCSRDTFVNAAIEIGDDHTFPIIDYDRTAARYFAAHPEPKPWYDAKPGEAWVLTIDGTEHLAQAITGRIAIYPHDADPEFFIPTLIPGNTIGDIWEHTWSPSDHRITAGRRIWPEESDDE